MHQGGLVDYNSESEAEGESSAAVEAAKTVAIVADNENPKALKTNPQNAGKTPEKKPLDKSNASNGDATISRGPKRANETKHKAASSKKDADRKEPRKERSGSRSEERAKKSEEKVKAKEKKSSSGKSKSGTHTFFLFLQCWQE